MKISQYNHHNAVIAFLFLAVICCGRATITATPVVTAENVADCGCKELLMQCFEVVEELQIRVKDCQQTYQQCQLECKKSRDYLLA